MGSSSMARGVSVRVTSANELEFVDGVAIEQHLALRLRPASCLARRTAWRTSEMGRGCARSRRNRLRGARSSGSATDELGAGAATAAGPAAEGGAAAPPSAPEIGWLTTRSSQRRHARTTGDAGQRDCFAAWLARRRRLGARHGNGVERRRETVDLEHDLFARHLGLAEAMFSMLMMRSSCPTP